MGRMFPSESGRLRSVMEPANSLLADLSGVKEAERETPVWPAWSERPVKSRFRSSYFTAFRGRAGRYFRSG